MIETEGTKHVKALIKKAAEAESPLEAMQYAQAAVNAANALAVLHNTK